MIKEFSSDDEYHSWCDEDPEYRLILNTDRKGYTQRFSCIHLASCKSIREPNQPNRFTKGDYEKVGSLEVYELENWLNDKRNQKGLRPIEVKQHSCTRKRSAQENRLDMNSKLKKLYENLIQQRKSVIVSWHDGYREFFNHVGEIRSKIENGYRLDHEIDAVFLQQLLYDKLNGIASVGQSTWSWEDFQLFIRDEDFMSSLEQLILTPNRENLLSFGDQWHAQKGYRNHARINRVATASTLEVSTTVDYKKFDVTFSWLMEMELIPKYNGENDWFSKNCYLLKFLKDVFEDELQRNKTDEFYLSQFVWELYEYSQRENKPKNSFQRLNLILYGPPGTGKTYSTARKCIEICDGSADEKSHEALRERFCELRDDGKRIEFVTFHQSYGYEEFVEGLRPETLAGKTAEIEDLSATEELAESDKGESTGGFGLKAEPGVLKRIAERARADRNNPYVLIIDEINRANISKVLGELVTLLEEDKREGAENEVCVTLPYSKKTFTLPRNLYILGTMNTADRSIALLDTALRRRFEFEEIPPNPDLLKEKEIEGVNLPNVLETINERLEYLIDRDHLIGHAWFMACESLEDVNNVMRNKIIPLLAEYFYDDWNKVRAVLGGGDHFITKRPLNHPPGLEEDGGGEDRYRWTVNKPSFSAQAYEHLIKPSRNQESGE